jgi:DNA-binding HxlR family transcriptional regulator
MKKITTSCPVERALHFIGGKWKLCIIQRLSTKIFRFNELRRTIPDISQKILTQELRMLEESGFVKRKVYQTKSPKVEYQLTIDGKNLLPLISKLEKWSISQENHINKLVIGYNNKIK